MSSAYLIAWAVIVYSLAAIGLYALVVWVASRRKPKK
jgi:hypothetical protein